MSTVIKDVSILKLIPRPGRRLQQDVIESLMSSIDEIGVLTPIRVRPATIYEGGQRIENGGFEITCGTHRFEAAQRLHQKDYTKCQTIPCVVVENEDDRNMEKARIDENLCRTDFGLAERAKFTAIRQAMYEEDHPGARWGGAAGKAVKGGKGGKVAQSATLVQGFVKDTAESTGKKERTVRLDAEHGRKISRKALDMVAGTDLDKKGYLNILKGMPQEEQVKVIEHDLEYGPRKNESGSKRMATGEKVSAGRVIRENSSGVDNRAAADRIIKEHQVADLKIIYDFIGEFLRALNAA